MNKNISIPSDKYEALILKYNKSKQYKESIPSSKQPQKPSENPSPFEKASLNDQRNKSLKSIKTNYSSKANLSSIAKSSVRQIIT